MAARPLLITLDPGQGPAQVREVLRGAGPGRWILVAEPGADAVVERVAATVLAGAVPVFGLAGVATWKRWRGLPAVPALRLGADQDTASAIDRFWTEHAGRGPVLEDDVLRLLASDRVSARTRGILARRGLADDPAYVPRALSSDALTTLRAVADRVVPQDGAPARHLDLAARVDAQLAAGRGDGWRPAVLPPDRVAYELALEELADLVGLGPADQDSVLTEVAAGERTPRATALTPAQLAAWFEDACNDLVRQWLAHPAHLTRVGFDGYATGGTELLGYPHPATPGREAWEPALSGSRDGGAA